MADQETLKKCQTEAGSPLPLLIQFLLGGNTAFRLKFIGLSKQKVLYVHKSHL
jgi:hypothetical protein